MRDYILNLKRDKSLYEIALEIGISEYSLYCYMNDYNKVSSKITNKIEKYVREKKNENKFDKSCELSGHG